MENNRRRKVSLLEGSSGDEFNFINKVLSRDSSVGCSSRVLYYRSPEGVPFQWEMQPGTPKDPRQEDALPTLIPPPAVLSLGFPKPCINVEEPRASMRSRLLFWKQSNKVIAGLNLKGNKVVNVKLNDFGCDNKSANSDQSYSSDCEEFMVSSPRNSSSSSSSSSFSSSNIVQSSQSSRLQSPAAAESTDHGLPGCSPLNFASILARVARR